MNDEPEEPQAPRPGREGPDDKPYSGLSPEMFRKLQSHLRESVILLDENWELVANLSAPNGLLGWGDPVGNHALAHVHPDDVINFVDVGQGLTATDPGWIGAAKMRLQRADGSYGRYETTMENRLHDPDYRGWVCTTRCVEDVVDTAPEMEAAEVTSSLLEALPQGVIVYGGDKILFSNAAANEVLRAGHQELAVLGLVPFVDEESVRTAGDAVRRLGRAPGTESVTLRALGEEVRQIEIRLTSRPNASAEEDRIHLVIGIVEDVTDELAQQEMLEQRANRDELTRIHNRAWLLDRLHELLRGGSAVAIAYLDLCGFKVVNDTLGHRAGDRVLAAIASGLVAEFGDDAVARVGGDEFIVFLPAGSDPDEFAVTVALSVAAVPEARRHEVTGNVGVAMSTPEDGPWDVIDRADHAMYEQKRADPRHHRHAHS